MKLFVILSRVPYPLEKGDKLRAFNQIKELSKKHEIYLCALNDHTIHPDAFSILSNYCKNIYIFPITKWSIFFNVLLFFFKGKPLQCGYFYRYSIQKKINKLIQTIQPDHIYSQLIRTTEYVKSQKIKKTLDYQDALSKGVNRMMEKAPFWKRFILSIEYKRLLRYEKDIFNSFDNHTIITHVDRVFISHPSVKSITVVPNGVDSTLFSPINIEKKYDLIFTGNFSYPPNIDAATFLVQDIFPILKEKHPNIRIVICGANPTPRVKSLQDENVIVTGWVDDIRIYYAQSRIFIAPMRLGTGLQNKLLEAMAMKIPCIASPLASEPLNAEKNKEIIMCNSILGYVDAIDMLLSDKAFYKTLSENAFLFVKKNYNWGHTTSILEKLLINNK